MATRGQYEEFDAYIRRLKAETSYHTFTYTPETVVEELVEELRALHCELARIAYPVNWPDDIPNELMSTYQWMQATAANALTNIGRKKSPNPTQTFPEDGMDDERTNW
jgi:hypothetical protein